MRLLLPVTVAAVISLIRFLQVALTAHSLTVLYCIICAAGSTMLLPQ